MTSPQSSRRSLLGSAAAGVAAQVVSISEPDVACLPTAAKLKERIAA